MTTNQSLRLRLSFMSSSSAVNEDGVSPPFHITTIIIVIIVTVVCHVVSRERAVGVSNRVWFHS